MLLDKPFTVIIELTLYQFLFAPIAFPVNSLIAFLKQNVGRSLRINLDPVSNAMESGHELVLGIEGNLRNARALLLFASRINAGLLASFRYMNSDTCVFSQAVKVAMGVLGVPVGECRLPLGPAPAGTDALARTVLQNLGYPA